MAHDLTAAAITASSAGSGYSVAVAVDMDFSSGHVRLHTGAGTITWDGKQFLGVGRFGGISVISESAELRADTVEFRLSGIPSEYVSTALNENYKHRDVTAYLMFLDSTGALVADPVTLWSGRMDTMPITLGAAATIVVRAESRLADWMRPRSSRYTNEEQQQRYSGDKGLEFVSQMVEKELIWGRG